MSRKHTDLEREFLDELARRTGRPLTDWMRAIDEAGIADRNQIIDWLRPQGLTFAHASWLERIHHNGGRPIYVGPNDRQLPAAPVPPTTTPTARPASPPKPQAQLPPQPKLRTTTPSTPPDRCPSATSDIATLLARGKGLRPLAELLLREIGQALPSATTSTRGDLIFLSNPADLAALSIGPRELRLGLVLGSIPTNELATPGRLAGGPTAITHVVVLTDARQIDKPLRDLIVLANAQANPI